LKRFRDWITGKKKEAQSMLFPPLINHKMLATDKYLIENDNKINIHIATEKDLDAIIAIQKACYNGEAPWSRLAVSNELKNKHKAFFLMGQHEERPVAFVGMSMRHNSLHITNIATIPLYQKRGIGTFLFKLVADLAEKLERDNITLEVRMSNENAKRLYRNLGFHDMSIKRNYYRSDGEDALDMIYPIDETDEFNESQSIK